MKFDGTKKVMVILFIVTIGLGFIANFSFLAIIAKTEVKAILGINDGFMQPTEIENAFNDNFYRQHDFINLNGMVHNALNQKIINGAIKDENDMLFLQSDVDYKFDKSIEDKSIKDTMAILDSSESQGTEVLYVQAPFKYIENKSKLPYGMTIAKNKQYDYWCQSLENGGYNVLDLRETIENEIKFYKTDHHWTIETSFYASKAIMHSINSNQKGVVSYNQDCFDRNKYDALEYDKSFLGSEGVKAGEYYVGKDDFTILTPKFETDFEYLHYINGENTLLKKGNFIEAFLDKNILDDKNYYNKYNACIYGGYVENKIINKNCSNDKKFLLISDSFSRPMVMYLSMAFAETRYLDPQEGRYNDSIIEYIDRYEPDVIIMMYTGTFVER